MDIRKLKKSDLTNLLLDKSQIKSKSLKKDILNEIITQRVFPLKIPKKYQKEKNIILNINDIIRVKGKWSIPKGLYLNVIDEDTFLINELINFSKKYFTQNVQKHLCDIYKVPKQIREKLMNIIKILYKNLYIDKSEKYIENNILKKSQISLLYYKYKPCEKFEGLKAHLNSTATHKGAISVITFDSSVLDFIPFNEFKKDNIFRVLIPQFSAITFDGDLRYCYTHGVPQGLKYKNKYRFALNIRHPYVKSKNINCDKCSLIKDWECHSNIDLPSLSSPTI